MNQRQLDILEIFADAQYQTRQHKLVMVPSFPEEKWTDEKLNTKFTVPLITNSELYDIHLQLQLQNNPRIKSKCR